MEWWGRNRHAVLVGLFTAVAAAAYSGYALVQYRTFQTSTYDLVIFDQAVRSYAHFQPGIAAVKGMHNGPGPHFSLLGDHWSPIIAVLAPLYRLPGLDGPWTLLVAQGVLFALAIPPVWAFARRIAGPRHAAAVGYFAAGAYALGWPVAEAVAFGFHEVAFVPLLSAVFLERLEAGRVRAALLAAGALLLVKEDMGLLVAGFGLFLLTSRSRVARQRLLGGALIAAGIGAAVLATYVLRPAFGGHADYYWAYWSLGRNLPQAAWHALTHPIAAAQLLITPRVKLHTMLWLFGGLLFLPLASPISLAAVPLLAERMLASSAPGWWGVRYQYNAFLAVVLVCAAVDGAATLRRFALWINSSRLAAGRVRAGAGRVSAFAVPAAVFPTALACAATVALVPRFAFGAALHPAFYQITPRDRAAAAAVAAVPSHVTVEASNGLGPQLSARATVLLWDWYPRWAPWVAADTGQHTFPFTSLAEQLQRVRFLEHNGYRVVLARDGYVVLHRQGTGRQ